MLKFKILIIGLVSIFLFNGCARHHISPVDVVAVGVVGAIMLDPYRAGYKSHHGHHYRNDYKRDYRRSYRRH